jgi:putative transposase
VARELGQLIVAYGKPKTIVSDSGTELTSNARRPQGRVALHRARQARSERLPSPSSVACATSCSMRRCSARSHIRAVLEAWRADHNNERPHSWLGWMSPAIYAATRRSAALRSTDGSAPRIAATAAQQGITDDHTPIANG